MTKPTLLLGQYDLTIREGRSITIPSALRKRFNDGSPYEQEFGIVLAAFLGVNRQLWLYKTKDLEAIWPTVSNGILWSREVCELVESSVIDKASPKYRTDVVASYIKNASAQLDAEMSQFGRNLSGKDFEKLVAEIFKSFGGTVQLNLSLGGGEIDILGIEFSNGGNPYFTLVECKQLSTSGKPIGIQQVMRLYGLREIVGSQFAVGNTVLVSTTGFTTNAKSYAKIYNLHLVEFQNLMGWIKANGCGNNPPEPPVFRIEQLSKTGRLNLSRQLIDYVRAKDDEISIIGVRDHAELWGRSQWSDRLKEVTFQRQEILDRQRHSENNSRDIDMGQ